MQKITMHKSCRMPGGFTFITFMINKSPGWGKHLKLTMLFFYMLGWAVYACGNMIVMHALDYNVDNSIHASCMLQCCMCMVYTHLIGFYRYNVYICDLGEIYRHLFGYGIFILSWWIRNWRSPKKSALKRSSPMHSGLLATAKIFPSSSYTSVC